MTVQSLRVRRSLTVAGAVLALILGLAAIQAAATWTASAAPLTAAPVASKTIEAALRDEQARSAELGARLAELSDSAKQLAVALQAARDQIATGADHAAQLEQDLADARTRLKALQRSIGTANRSAPAAVQPRTASAGTAALRDGSEGSEDAAEPQRSETTGDPEGGDD